MERIKTWREEKHRERGITERKETERERKRERRETLREIKIVRREKHGEEKYGVKINMER